MTTLTEFAVEHRANLDPAIEPRPPRIAGLASAFLLHAGVAFFFLSGSPPPASPPEEIEVTVLAEADTGAEASKPSREESATPAEPESTPSPVPVATPSVAETLPPPSPVPTPVASELPRPPEPEPTPTPTSEAIELAPAKATSVPTAEISPSPEPSAAPVALEPQARAPAPSPAAQQRQPKQAISTARAKTPMRPVVAARARPVPKPPKIAKAEREPSPTTALATTGNPARRQTGREGAARGSADASPIARASYAALLAAEIARHKAYPEAARAAGVTGSVGVALTVGPSGRIVSHAITRSSGSVALDREVDAMMAEVQAPPPPGGIFRAGLTIHFGLE